MFRGINLCGAENNAKLPEQHRAHLSRISNQNFTQPLPSCQDRKNLFIDVSIYFVWVLQKPGELLWSWPGFVCFLIGVIVLDRDEER